MPNKKTRNLTTEVRRLWLCPVSLTHRSNHKGAEQPPRKRTQLEVQSVEGTRLSGRHVVDDDA